jgi:hypothetical protein
MESNPVLRPKLATPALILSSVVVLVCILCLIGLMTSNALSSLALLIAMLVSSLLAVAVGAVWFTSSRRLRAWTAAANDKWNQFDEMRRTLRTTTEITVLSVDALEPTGSWITIRWDRFDHVQRAWIEALHEPIWPGAALLIAPDRAQLQPGLPWPPVYRVGASDCLAWAPAAARRTTQLDRRDSTKLAGPSPISPC